MSSKTVIEDLTALYEGAVERLRTDILDYVRSGTLPSPERRTDGSYCYPELRVRYGGGPPPSDRTRAFGRLHQPGIYATTVTRPELFTGYLAEQIDLLIGDFDVAIETGRSRQEIPFPYVLDGQHGAGLAGVSPNELARHFPTTELALIGDKLADCIELGDPAQPPAGGEELAVPGLVVAVLDPLDRGEDLPCVAQPPRHPAQRDPHLEVELFVLEPADTPQAR